jgi:hypothetical protein
MAITFPRDMPTLRFRPGSTLAIERQLAQSPTRGALVQVAELGTPIWKARYQTVPVREAVGLQWEAWLASLRGGARTFRAVHPFRRTALAYPGGYGGLTRHGGGAFDGTCTLSAVATPLDAVTLSGLPSTFVLSVGDLLSFSPAGSRQALHRVVEGGTASAGVLVVGVEPALKPGATIGATVSMLSPWAKAVVDQKTIRIDWQAPALATVTFEAWQVLN